MMPTFGQTSVYFYGHRIGNAAQADNLHGSLWIGPGYRLGFTPSRYGSPFMNGFNLLTSHLNLISIISNVVLNNENFTAYCRKGCR